MNKPDRQLAILVGQNIRKFRNELGLTQEELGLIMGYSLRSAKKMISAYETGRRFSIKVLPKLAKKLRKPVTAFFE